MYTFGGSPSAVLTTVSGDVVPNYPVLVRVAGTGELVTALFEADGVTPIAQLRTGAAGSSAPGAIRTFKCAHPAIEYEYNASSGPVRWYEAAREVGASALTQALDALSRSAGGTVSGPLTATNSLTVGNGLAVTGNTVTDNLVVTSNAHVGGTVAAGGGFDLSGMRIYNPRVFGATGSGAGDDAPAIQAALTAAKVAGGGWVIIPTGTYRLATLPLRIYRNTRLTLMPGTTLVRAADGTMLLNGDAGQTLGGYTGHGDLTIEGGVWDMQATAPGLTASRMCISIGHARNVTVRDLEVRDTPGFHAIEFNAVKVGIIDGCQFRGFTDPGGRPMSEAVQIDLAKEADAFGGFGPYDHTPCEDISVTRCYVGASGTAGTVAWPRGVGSHSATIGRSHKRIRVSDCSFEGLSREGVRGYAWEESQVTGCSFVGCVGGVQMRTVDTARLNDTLNTSGVQTSSSQNAWAVIVDSNTFIDCGSSYAPIHLQGESTGRIILAEVTRNTIRSVSSGTQDAIRVDYAYRTVVQGNTIHGPAGIGVHLNQSAGCMITDNRVHDAGSSGIYVNQTSESSIDGNSCTNLGLNGIHVAAGTQLKITDNFVKGAGRTSGTGYGIRVTTGTVGITITGNTYRKTGSGNEAIYALSITSGQSGVRRFGNDWVGQGAGPTAVEDSSSGPVLSPYDTGA